MPDPLRDQMRAAVRWRAAFHTRLAAFLEASGTLNACRCLSRNRAIRGFRHGFTGSVAFDEEARSGSCLLSGARPRTSQSMKGRPVSRVTPRIVVVPDVCRGTMGWFRKLAVDLISRFPVIPIDNGRATHHAAFTSLP